MLWSTDCQKWYIFWPMSRGCIMSSHVQLLKVACIFFLSYSLTSYWFELNAGSDPRFFYVKETVPSGFDCIIRFILVQWAWPLTHRCWKLLPVFFYCFYLACSAGVFWVGESLLIGSLRWSLHLWFYDRGRLGRVEIVTLTSRLKPFAHARWKRLHCRLVFIDAFILRIALKRLFDK